MLSIKMPKKDSCNTTCQEQIDPAVLGGRHKVTPRFPAENEQAISTAVAGLRCLTFLWPLYHVDFTLWAQPG